MESFGSAWWRSRRIKRLRASGEDGSDAPVLARELIIRAAQMLRRERPAEALKAIEEAIVLHERWATASRESRVGLAEATSMKALVLCELKCFDEAEPVASEALRLAETLHEQNPDEQALALVRTANYLLAACAASGGSDAQ